MKTEFLFYASGIRSGSVDFSLTGNEERDAAQHPDVRQLYPLWEADKGEKRWTQERVTLGGRNYQYHTDMGRGRIYGDMDSSEPIDIATYDGYLCGFLFPGRNESRTWVADGYQDCTSLIYWQEPYIALPLREIRSSETIMVPMNDGIRLATDVILPQGGSKEKFPSILIRTCYNKDNNRSLWERYARRGYAVIVQDCRGREASEGEWLPFINESSDGNDTLNWIAKQPFSNGDVGMLGGSYLGYVQWAAAASGNPHLKAMVSQVTAGSPFMDLPRRGGVMESGILAWSFMVAKKETDPEACVRSDWEQLLCHRPICEIPLVGLGEAIPFYDQWMAHPDCDEFWKPAAWEERADAINVPCLYVSGWFDDDGPGTSVAWEMNQRRGRKHQRMILGPWLHKTNSTRRIHSLSLPPNALRYDLDSLYLRWFDRFLKGVDNQVDQGPPVEYYMLGEGSWKKAACWPPENAVCTPFYLIGEAALATESQEAEASLSYSFNPADPFPYVIDVSENECAVPGDYTEAENRDDVLLFTSPVLTEPVSIAGDVYGIIKAASSCPDTDWVVRLTDVGPREGGRPGRSVRLSDGILRARYRHSYEEPEFLTPGKPEIFEIRMTRIAHTFLPGHRIRIQVTSGAAGFCFANSNTGKDEAHEVTLISASQTIFIGGKEGSFIKLPVLKL